MDIHKNGSMLIVSNSEGKRSRVIRVCPSQAKPYTIFYTYSIFVIIDFQGQWQQVWILFRFYSLVPVITFSLQQPGIMKK